MLAKMPRAAVARALGAALLVAWFAYFIRPALFNGFNDDDPMNMHGYFRTGWPELIRKMAVFFEPSYRPVGGALFKASYSLFGYEPFPLHVMIAAVLLYNIFLTRRFAELVSGSAPVGLLCAFAAAYHARMPNLYYAPAFLYDVLCFAFYFSALNLYLGERAAGRVPGPKRLLAVFALYIGAMGSKEMAVTFPAVLLLYEAIFHPPAGFGWRPLRGWLRGPALAALIAGGMTALFIAGKSFGPDALVAAPGYRMSATPAHIMAEQAKYLNDIFYARFDRPWFTPPLAVLLWVAVAGYAAITRRKYLGWAGLSAMVTPLPISVLIGRGGSSLYIPLVFWALVAATLFLDLCTAVPRLLPASFRRLGSALLASAGAAAFAAMVVYQNRFATQHMAMPTVLAEHIASEVRRVLPRVPPRTRAVYLNDLTKFWDTYFITELIWGDPTVTVYLQQHSRLPQKEIDGMDYVLEWTPERTLRIVRSRGAGERRSGR